MIDKGCIENEKMNWILTIENDNVKNRENQILNVKRKNWKKRIEDNETSIGSWEFKNKIIRII